MSISETHENMNPIKRILLVEGHTATADELSQQLLQKNCVVDVAVSCVQALALMQECDYDLILLDEMLMDQNAGEFCADIRSCCTCPIIFVSFCSDSQSVVAALKNGGDDYMVKPIDYKELLARAEAISRRVRGGEKNADNLRSFRSFSVDTVCRHVLQNGQIVELTPIEYALLIYFADHPNTLLMYQELYEQIWSCDSLGDSRTVKVHISNLRKKLDPQHKGLISTVRGTGYIFSDI